MSRLFLWMSLFFLVSRPSFALPILDYQRSMPSSAVDPQNIEDDVTQFARLAGALISLPKEDSGRRELVGQIETILVRLDADAQSPHIRNLRSRGGLVVSGLGFMILFGSEQYHRFMGFSGDNLLCTWGFVAVCAVGSAIVGLYDREQNRNQIERLSHLFWTEFHKAWNRPYPENPAQWLSNELNSALAMTSRCQTLIKELTKPRL